MGSQACRQSTYDPREVPYFLQLQGILQGILLLMRRLELPARILSARILAERTAGLRSGALKPQLRSGARILTYQTP